jgi:hypothetical protein
MADVIKGKKTHKTGTKRMYRLMTLQVPPLMDVLTLSVVMAAALHAASCGLSSYYRRTHFLHFYHEEGGSRLPVHCATVVITTRKQNVCISKLRQETQRSPFAIAGRP